MKSFKHKLMAFACLICAILVGISVIFSTFLLEPAYRAMIKRDLRREMDAIQRIIDENGLLNAAGTDFADAVKTGVSPLVVDGQCLEISGLDSGRYIGGVDHIAGCTLHTEHLDTNWMRWVERRSDDNMLLLRLRTAAAQEGGIATEVQGQNGTAQYVLGRVLPNEGVVLLLSVSMERVSQAVTVLQRQSLWIGMVMVVVALVMAWIFATLFTRPITALSAAARRMAKGDYSVQLPVTRRDEIGVLTQDFNTMAREVSRTDALQRDLIANVSHDLRTPRTIIKGYAETIRDLTGEDAVRRGEQLDIIISEADRLGALVGSVMELSRLDAGTEPFAPVVFDISDFCEEMCYRYQDICQKNGYQLRLETPGERLISADPAMMARLLHNLVANAIAHIGPDGTVVLRVQDVAAGVRVEVEDHGAGIAPDELPHVFRRYYRARQANGRQGTGLGLSIVRAILLRHQFSFGARSTLGAGSVFWFEAPVYPKAPPRPEGRTVPRAPAQPARTGTAQPK